MPAPTFLAPTRHVAEINGQALAFYPMTAPVFLRVQASVGPLALRAFSGDADAAGELMRALGDNGELVATVVLDALRDEEWVKRPVSPKAAHAFLDACDGPALMAMLGACAEANKAGFAPLAQGLAASLRRWTQDAASLTGTATATSSPAN